MIVSINSDPNRSEFDLLLSSTLKELNFKAKVSSHNISTLLGRKLEPYVRDVMTELAVGTPFENSIELIGGQKFPDIVAKKFYGIEVKTTTQNHWKTTGNSVLESSRIESVERIFMLFAKMTSPIEFRCRPYEDVLSEVVVTHSPRYLIDMNLEKGNTIFDKINIPYDTLRQKDNPIKSIVDYYKNKLNPGEELWWIGQESSYSATNLIIRIWNNLTVDERNVLKVKAMAYFPELFGVKSDKFGRLGLWLTTRESVVCPNVRDLFSAGGRGSFTIKEKTLNNIPRILINLFENAVQISEVVKQTPVIELNYHWKVTTSEKTKLNDWMEIVAEEAFRLRDAKHLDVRQLLIDIIDE